MEMQKKKKKKALITGKCRNILKTLVLEECAHVPLSLIQAVSFPLSFILAWGRACALIL